MGFETSAVIAIFFVSSVILGTSVYSVVSTSNAMVEEASDERYELQNEKLQTDITITNSSLASGDENGYDLAVSVSNTGSQTLQADELDVLVDGVIKTYSLPSSTTTWTPRQIKNITVSGLSGAGSHRVKLVTENGISDYDVYTV